VTGGGRKRVCLCIRTNWLPHVCLILRNFAYLTKKQKFRLAPQLSDGRTDIWDGFIRSTVSDLKTSTSVIIKGAEHKVKIYYVTVTMDKLEPSLSVTI